MNRRLRMQDDGRSAAHRMMVFCMMMAVRLLCLGLAVVFLLLMLPAALLLAMFRSLSFWNDVQQSIDSGRSCRLSVYCRPVADNGCDSSSGGADDLCAVSDLQKSSQFCSRSMTMTAEDRMRVVLVGGPCDGLVLLAPPGVQELPDNLSVEFTTDGTFHVELSMYLLGWRIEGEE